MLGNKFSLNVFLNQIVIVNVAETRTERNAYVTSINLIQNHRQVGCPQNYKNHHNRQDIASSIPAYNVIACTLMIQLSSSL